MTQKLAQGLVETRHHISQADQESKKDVLATLQSHFVNMAGTMREAYDAMTATTPIAKNIALHELDQQEFRGWRLQPEGAQNDRAILFLHGGAYLMGSAKAYRGLASQLAVRTGVTTFVLDYPLAPEHPFPEAFKAAVAANRWLGEQGYSQLALIGDSAGAGVALGAMDNKQNLSEIVAVVAFSPWTDLAFTGASFNDPATYDPIFHSPQVLRDAAKTYLSGADAKDGRASPLFKISEVSAPLLIQVGTDELLFDDARQYANSVAARGGEVALEIYEGLHHVFQQSVTELEGARHALDRAASFVQSHWRPAES